MDVQEMDAASEAGVEEVRRNIVEVAEYRPTECRYRIFIIDEVHDLSAKAFDALLKTIEEPPSHVVFILATTEFNKVPPTIRSRCQKFEFHRGSIQDLVSRLTTVCQGEQVEAEPAALLAIARLADGGYRDALTYLEQVVITADGKITLDHVFRQLGLVSDDAADRLIQALATQEVAGISVAMDEIYQMGRDSRSIVESLLHRLSDLTRAHYQVTGVNDPTLEAGLLAMAQRVGIEKILALRGGLAEAHKALGEVTIPRIWLEAELIRLSRTLSEPKAVPATPAPAQSQRSTQSVQTEKPAQPAMNPEPAVAVPSQASSGGTTVMPSDNPKNIVWQKVVSALSAQSATAKNRLPKSRAIGGTEGVVTIEFERRTDAEWVQSKLPLLKALAESWKSFSGEEVTFNIVAGSNSIADRSIAMEPTAVELPLEGKQLIEAFHQVFDTLTPELSQEKKK